MTPTPVREGLFQVDPPALLVGGCGDCGALHFPGRRLCPECRSEQIETRAMSGRGSVYAHTVVHAAPPGYLGPTPYAIGIVALEEPLRVAATLLAADLERLRIGDPVEFELLELGGDRSRLGYCYRRREEG